MHCTFFREGKRVTVPPTIFFYILKAEKAATYNAPKCYMSKLTTVNLQPRRTCRSLNLSQGLSLPWSRLAQGLERDWNKKFMIMKVLLAAATVPNGQ